MKKIISVFVAISMCIALFAGCGSGSGDSGGIAGTGQQAEETGQQDAESVKTEAEDGNGGDAAEYDESSFAASFPQNKYSESWDCPNTGFTFDVPGELREYKGQFFPSDSGQTDNSSGIYEGHIHYLARTNEEMAEFDALLKSSEELDLNNSEQVQEYQNKITEFYEYRNMVPVIILGIKNNLNFDEVVANEYYYFPVGETGEIGTAGDINFYYIITDYSAYEEEMEKEIPEDLLAEFNDVMANVKDFIPRITVKEPLKTASLPEDGDVLSFDTTDLDGNPVTSQDLFAGHKVTMINLWATWCGPCLNELSELEKLNKELEEKGCQIVGICLDTSKGADVIESAKKILADKGVTYTNLVSTAAIESMFPVPAIPTSFFVDSEGRILTDSVTGADFDQYRARIEEALKAVGE